MTVKGWHRVLTLRRVISWGLLALLCVALANPEDLETIITKLPKRQLGQLAAGWFSAGEAFARPFLIMAASTVVFGRWFCGWLCPLGASMDLARLIRSKIKGGGRLAYAPDRLWRSMVPLALWASFWIGLSFPFGELEPYAVVVSGPAVWLGVSLYAAFRGRGFCNSACPTGWLAGLMGARSLAGLSIDPQKCRRCGRCQAVCPARCLDHKTSEIDRARCLVCLECAAACPDGAVGFGRRAFLGAGDGPDRRRRDFLRLFGAAVFTGGAWVSGAGARASVLGPPTGAPILPPGALSLANLAAHCTGCQTCVRACPNEALNAAHSGGAIMLGKPVLEPYIGFCQYDCVLCGKVCPTGAITELTPEVKRTHRIGLAALDRLECVIVKNGTSCGACAELCPSGALRMATGPSGRLEPTLDENFCIGCGACQKACPVRPVAAVTVSGLLIQQTAKTPVVLDLPDEVLGEEFPF